MSADAPLVSVIVPVYRRTEWIGRCLSALARQDRRLPFEVVIVDDGSPDRDRMAAAVDEAVSSTALDVRFYRKENGGPAAARNFAVRHSSGEILCFIDDDSVVEPGWLAAVADTFRTDLSVSVVSGKILSWDRHNELPLLLERHVYRGVHWATCNIAYRRAAFEALGGFDERFREASWEDNDLGLRARWAGFRQRHNELAVVRHPHEESLAEYREKCLVNGRGGAVFTRKHLARKPLWAVAVPVIMSRNLLLAPFPSVIAGRLSGRYLSFLWSYHSLRGYLAAITGRTRGKN